MLNTTTSLREREGRNSGISEKVAALNPNNKLRTLLKSIHTVRKPRETRWRGRSWSLSSRLAGRTTCLWTGDWVAIARWARCQRRTRCDWGTCVSRRSRWDRRGSRRRERSSIWMICTLMKTRPRSILGGSLTGGNLSRRLMTFKMIYQCLVMMTRRLTGIREWENLMKRWSWPWTLAGVADSLLSSQWSRRVKTHKRPERKSLRKSLLNLKLIKQLNTRLKKQPRSWPNNLMISILISYPYWTCPK